MRAGILRAFIELREHLLCGVFLKAVDKLLPVASLILLISYPFALALSLIWYKINIIFFLWLLLRFLLFLLLLSVFLALLGLLFRFGNTGDKVVHLLSKVVNLLRLLELRLRQCSFDDLSSELIL